MSREAAVLAIVAAFAATCLAIGAVAWRRTRAARDFYVAGRSLGPVVTALAIAASTMSGFAFVGGPGLVYRFGSSSFWMLITGPMAHVLVFAVLSRPLAARARKCDAVSIPDVIQDRYGSRILTGLVAGAMLVGIAGYLATQVLAMGVVLEGLTADIASLAGVSLTTWSALAAVVLVAYCALGGALASVWTDVFQGIVMVVSATAVFWLARHAFEDGFTGMTSILRAEDRGAIGAFGTLGPAACLSWYLLFTVGALGQPHIVTKFMMAREGAAGRSTLLMVVAAGVLGALLWLAVGVAMKALVVSGEHAPLARPDDASIAFVTEHASPILAGLVFAALLAAILSTADAFLNIGSAALVNDLPRALRGRPLARPLVWGRLGTVALGLLAWSLAVRPSQLVGALGVASWGIFAAVLVPVLAIGLVWPRADARAGIAAVVVGAAIAVVPGTCGISFAGAVSPGALAMAVAIVVFVAGSATVKPRA